MRASTSVRCPHSFGSAKLELPGGPRRSARRPPRVARAGMPQMSDWLVFNGAYRRGSPRTKLWLRRPQGRQRGTVTMGGNAEAPNESSHPVGGASASRTLPGVCEPRVRSHSFCEMRICTGRLRAWCACWLAGPSRQEPLRHGGGLQDLDASRGGEPQTKGTSALSVSTLWWGSARFPDL